MRRHWQHFRWRWLTSARHKRVNASMWRIYNYYTLYW